MTNFSKKYNVDEKAVIEAAKVNPNRFGPLYNYYYNPIFRYVFQKIRDEETTADITSKVFLKALLNLKNYKHLGFPFSSWLYKIASNEINMHFRKQNKINEVELNERDVIHLIEEIDEQLTGKEIENVIDVLNSLPIYEMELIDLRFFEKHSFREIGEILGISEGNAKIKVYRVLEKMKKLLTKK